MTTPVAEVIVVVCLIAVLGFAVVRPRGMPEGVGAVPAAIVVVTVGALPLAVAWQEVEGLGPTVAFLSAILMLAHLCKEEGMLRAARLGCSGWSPATSLSSPHPATPASGRRPRCSRWSSSL